MKAQMGRNIFRKAIRPQSFLLGTQKVGNQLNIWNINVTLEGFRHFHTAKVSLKE
ncbi:hypothetical protein DPMN_186644 [Dreissena polymorpha]|uniref:Uncharacterized protein n=1 Tax=Dreissena polymorpha TaxID=45954 RepID=A0A9D4I6P8_DREPO|nr:hypothetical protein DPMN_186644 [Dreissena polymorpha]